MIFDLSCLASSSINDDISKNYESFKYEAFQIALELVAIANRNANLLKKDFMTAFHHVSSNFYDY